MTVAERQISMPGEAPAAADVAPPPVAPAPGRRKPGPKSAAEKAAEAAARAATGDDLAEFDTDDLPPRPASPEPFSAQQQALVEQMIGAAVQQALSSRDPATAARLAAEKARKATEVLPTQEQAQAMCDDMVARNIRPRAIMTTDGWYVHPEMARTANTAAAGPRLDQVGA